MNGFLKVIKENLVAIIFVVTGIIASFSVVKSTQNQHGIRIDKLEDKTTSYIQQVVELKTKVDMMYDMLKDIKQEIKKGR